MLTPVEIQNKEFKSGVNGYKKEEVEEFLALVHSEFDMLYKENIALKDKVNMLSEAIKQYKSMENVLQNTIVTAQNVADELKQTAQLNADNLKKEAENKATEILIKAKEQTNEILMKNEALKQNYELYKTRIKSIIETQLKIISEEESL